MITYFLTDIEVVGSHVVVLFSSSKSSTSFHFTTTVKDFRDSLNNSLRLNICNPFFRCSGVSFRLDDAHIRELVLVFNSMTK